MKIYKTDLRSDIYDKTLVNAPTCACARCIHQYFSLPGKILYGNHGDCQEPKFCS